MGYCYSGRIVCDMDIGIATFVVKVFAKLTVPHEVANPTKKQKC